MWEVAHAGEARTECIIHRRQLILGVPSIDGSRDTEWEGKIEALNETVSEVMALDHAEIPDFFPPYFELESISRERNRI